MNSRSHYIMKFGGSCLSDARDMRNAALIVSRYRNCVVVASAMKGVTQSLIEVADSTGRNQQILKMDHLKRIHMDALSGIQDEYLHNEAVREIDYMLEILSEILGGLQTPAEPDQKAHILSFGERLSSVALKWYIKDLGIKSVCVNSDEIIFSENDDHLNASVDEEVSMSEIRSRILFHAELSEIPVVTGFFCSSLSGRTALLGRNSSDYTAALVAYSLPTYELVFWKDVPGMMTGDPKIVRESHVLKLLTYKQAEGYIINGAKVLHPKVIELARKKGITIRVLDFRNPESEGTLITDAVPSVEFMR